MSAVPDAVSPTVTSEAPATPGEVSQPGPAARFRAWPRAGRWASYAVVVLVLLVVAAMVAAVVVVRKPFPDTDGEIAVPGLSNLAGSLFRKITADKNPCTTAMQE